MLCRHSENARGIRRVKGCFQKLAVLCVVLAPAGVLAQPAPPDNPWHWPVSTCVSRAQPMPGPVLLQVRTNPAKPGKIHELRVGKDGNLYAREKTLENWIGRPPRGRHFPADGAVWYALNTQLAGRYRFDSCTQTLWLAPLPQTLPGQDFNLRNVPSYTLLPRATGAAVSADVQHIVQSAGRPFTTGTANVDVFGAPGIGHSSWLFDTHETRRLNSLLEFDDPSSRARLIVGDSITQARQFSVAPVRFGGVQWGTNFALDPLFNPLALPSLSGSAALPGTLQIYRDGVLQSSHPAQAGPFRLNNVPVLTGIGTLQVVTTNALGRQVTTSVPFYHSVQLLAPGLTDYSTAAGWLREDYTLSTDRYTQAFAAAGTRYGLSDTTTVGARAQGSGAVQDYSLLLAHAWPRLGLLTLEATASTGGEPGWAGTVGVQRNGRDYGAGATLRLTSRHYRELGNPYVPMRRFNSYAYARLVRDVHLQVNYTAESYRQGLDLRLLGAGLSFDLKPSGWFLTMSILRAIPGGNSYNFTFIHRIGSRGNVSAGGARDPSRGNYMHLAAQQGPAGPVGTSYNVYAETGPYGVRNAQIRHTTEHYGANVTVRSFNHTQAARIEARSGLAFVDGDVFTVRDPEQGFAVVHLPGAANIPVYRDNLPAGETDGSGHALIPRMLPYQPVSISVSPSDLPVTLPLSKTRMRVAVPNGAAVVQFPSDGPVRRSLHLMLANGSPVPAGARLFIDGKAAALPVGYDGLVYLNLSQAHQLRAVWPGGECSSMVESRDKHDAQVVCEEQHP